MSSGNNNTSTNTTQTTAGSKSSGGVSGAVVGAIIGGILIIGIIVVVIICVRKRREAEAKKKLTAQDNIVGNKIGQENNKVVDKDKNSIQFSEEKNPDANSDVKNKEKTSKIRQESNTQVERDVSKEEAFGGTGNISIMFKNDEEQDEFGEDSESSKAANDISNEITLDKTNRKLMENSTDNVKSYRNIGNNYSNNRSYSKKEKTQAYKNAVDLFTEKLKKIDHDHREMSILEEIEMMKNNKKPKKYINGITGILGVNTPTPIDDKSSQILESEKSHVSGVSAYRIAKKQSHTNAICYTDENREEPDDSFYNQKIEDINLEKIRQEELEAKKAEKEIEEKFKKKLQRIAEEEEDDDVGLYLDDGTGSELGANKKAKEHLEVKDHAIMTDFSQPKNVEILKDSAKRLKR